jgi:YggT family protein
MFVIGNLLQAVAVILGRALQIYYWIILIAVIISWVRPDPFNPIVSLLRAMTEPFFDWIRRKLPFAVVGGMDLSPLIAFFIIVFAQEFLVRTLFDLSVRLR